MVYPILSHKRTSPTIHTYIPHLAKASCCVLRYPTKRATRQGIKGDFQPTVDDVLRTSMHFFKTEVYCPPLNEFGNRSCLTFILSAKRTQLTHFLNTCKKRLQPKPDSAAALQKWRQ